MWPRRRQRRGEAGATPNSLQLQHDCAFRDSWSAHTLRPPHAASDSISTLACAFRKSTGTSNSRCRRVQLLHWIALDALGAPCQLPLLAGPEHGRTIPLADESPPDDTSIIAAPTSPVPSRHVRRVRRPVGAGTEEPVV